jgi:hypothetical protein
MDTLHLQRTQHTGHAAAACLRGLAQTALEPGSPRRTALSLVETLRRNPQANGQFWLIDDRADPEQPGLAISAWPLWFSDSARNDERPLFYFTRSATSAHLEMLTAQTADRGIILNDIESLPSRWAKGAHPWLPLWLAANWHCLPFDPANGAEAQAIMEGALREFYLEGRQGFCYLTLHDAADDAGECDPRAAYRGMYRLCGSVAPQVRLLGAGHMLQEVRAAARQLEQDWGMACEVWSCPSYTRLAREAAAVLQWNRSHRQHAARRSHLDECLGSSGVPVVAVTGYDAFVVNQLAAHVDAPFTALGSDTLALDQNLGRHWITFTALQALAREGVVGPRVLSRALRRYGLA